MRIMVFDVPAESGGALSVLHEFYNEFKLDQDNEYFFVLSLPELKETKNIKVLRFPWVKKSWFHRLYFDYVIAPKLTIKYKVDKVVSLQNIIIPWIKVYQSVLVHNALPFSNYRFSIKESKLLWIYQNIIGRKIKRSVKRANHILVQTNWMKEKIIEQLCIESKKIEVKCSEIEITPKRTYLKTENSRTTFFYPASGAIFKNHKVIIEACLRLKKDGIPGYNVIFTLSGDENEDIAKLHNTVKENQLPVEFVGTLTREEVFDFYEKSILLFPSYIETVGLPLLEAKKTETPVIAADCEYAHEMLEDYDKAYYFDPFSCEALCKTVTDFLKS